MTNQAESYYQPKTFREYKSKYPNAGVILDLDPKYLKLSACKWGREHLIACRVIRQVGGKILLVLKDFAPKPKDLKRQEEWANIERLINGPSKGNLRYKSRLELERENGNLGTLWSALAKSVAFQASDSEQRQTRQTQRRGSASSNHIRMLPSSRPGAAARLSQQSFEPRSPYASDVSQDRHKNISPTLSQSARGSSTRLSQKSYKLYSSNNSEIDEDEHYDRTKLEVVTVNLAGAFLRYVLNFCAGQNLVKKWILELREEPVRVRSSSLPSLKLDATDDGGIWSVITIERGTHPWVWESRLALLEAKKGFQLIDDANRPVLSNAYLAQYTCEALTAFRKNPGQNNVFLIAVTQTIISFFHFRMTPEYIQYLECADVEEQRTSDAYLLVKQTDFFKLDNKEGRKYALYNLLGLVKFWEGQQVVEKAGGSEGRDNNSVNLEGGGEGDSEDFSPRDRKRRRRC